MNLPFVKTHQPCNDCGSSDGLSINDDGWTHCFVCEARRGSQSDVNAVNHRSVPVEAIQQVTEEFSDVVYKTIIERGISSDTAKAYKCYKNGDDFHFGYTDDKGNVVAAKHRDSQKKFSISGDWKQAQLYGQHLFGRGGKYVTVVEGEFDAMAAYQMLGSKWPVVSIRNGAASAVKDIQKQYEWLDSFDSIVICFDADEPGQRAAQQVAELFGSKAQLFKHRDGFKDASDYLQSRKNKEFSDQWWSAEVHVPDGIIVGSSLYDEVMKPLSPSDCEYPFAGVNRLTYGIRKGELVTITAGSGLGKSQFVREIVWHILNKTEDNLGLMFLEESVRKTALSLMSLAANTPLHLPDNNATEQEKKDAFERTLATDRIYLFDHFGSTSVDNIINRVRYLARGLGCGYIFLDHISIVVSAQASGDERKAIDEIMTKLRMLVQETGIALIVVSHLKRPESKGHEEGAATSLAQLRGSGAIAQLSDMVLGLERNGQADDLTERNTTRVRVLKNRFSGTTGPACSLLYNHTTGRMTEVKDEDL
jgi:twinkle protein